MRLIECGSNSIDRRSVVVVSQMLSRRSLIGVLGSAFLASSSRAQALPEVAVTKDPSCACCDAWVEHLKGAGFPVRLEQAPVNPLKAKLRIPRELYSCHTGLVGGYAIEGHVPATTIKRLLAERPSAIGLAVPRMPVGSPGMEVEGIEPDTYDVIIFGAFGTRAFARFRGSREL